MSDVLLIITDHVARRWRYAAMSYLFAVIALLSLAVALLLGLNHQDYWWYMGAEYVAAFGVVIAHRLSNANLRRTITDPAEILAFADRYDFPR